VTTALTTAFVFNRRYVVFFPLLDPDRRRRGQFLFRNIDGWDVTRINNFVSSGNFAVPTSVVDGTDRQFFALRGSFTYKNILEGRDIWVAWASANLLRVD
jgi:hypothetical protein